MKAGVRFSAASRVSCRMMRSSGRLSGDRDCPVFRHLRRMQACGVHKGVRKASEREERGNRTRQGVLCVANGAAEGYNSKPSQLHSGWKQKACPAELQQGAHHRSGPWLAPYLQVRLHHVARLRLCVQHQVNGVALRHQQVPAVAERVQHNHQQAGLACSTQQCCSTQVVFSVS